MDNGDRDLGSESRILQERLQQQPLVGESAPMGNANGDSLAVSSCLSLLVSPSVVEGRRVAGSSGKVLGATRAILEFLAANIY